MMGQIIHVEGSVVHSPPSPFGFFCVLVVVLFRLSFLWRLSSMKAILELVPLYKLVETPINCEAFHQLNSIELKSIKLILKSTKTDFHLTSIPLNWTNVDRKSSPSKLIFQLKSKSNFTWFHCNFHQKIISCKSWPANFVL